MAMHEAPSPARYDPPSSGRQLTDAICVAVLGAGLWLAASAIARVSAQSPGLVDCQAPVQQHASASAVPGAAALAECGDKAAKPAPQH
jgi:hypothetical protein